MRLAPVRVGITLSWPMLLSSAAFVFADRMIEAHQRFCGWLLATIHIPLQGWTELRLFPEFGHAAIPLVPVRSYFGDSLTLFGLSAISFAALFALYRFLPLARNFLLFVIGLLIFAVCLLFFWPAYEVDSVRFELLWLRSQLVLWLVLPWLCSFLILPVQPSAILGVWWILVIQGYGWVWSALRLAFCLGILHFTGGLYAALLWFCLGPLSDLLYVLVFYSAVIHLACRRLWGLRTT
jgi:hypothetical protein